ncbi:unnamed protein product [Malus baccata var. baccata]
MGEITEEEELIPISNNSSIVNGDEEFEKKKKKKVEIVVRTIGPAPPSRLQVPSSITVHDLRKLIAENGHLPIERLRLILRGNVLHDSKSAQDVYLQLNDGDSLIVAVKPKPPVKHLRDGFDDDDDDEDLKFQLPLSSSPWKRALYSFLHDKMKLPDGTLALYMYVSSFLLVPVVINSNVVDLFHFHPKREWARWAEGFAGARLGSRSAPQDVQGVHILATGFVVILVNLGKRQPGDVSAYSIFNEDFRELPGTLNAERLDGDIRTGRNPQPKQQPKNRVLLQQQVQLTVQNTKQTYHPGRREGILITRPKLVSGCYENVTLTHPHQKHVCVKHVKDEKKMNAVDAQKKDELN